MTAVGGTIRIALALLFVVHGIAHLPGFLVPSVLGWPQARVGVALNLVLLAYLRLGTRLGWLLGGTG